MQTTCQDLAGLRLVPASGVPVLRFPDLGAEGILVHGITTRLGGVSEGPFSSLNLSLSVGDDPIAVAENRRIAASAVGVSHDRVAFARQMSGGDAAVVDGPVTGDAPSVDALATATPGVYLRMGFGDCLPIIMCDPSVPAVALAHAGWRGTVARVVLAAWEALRSLGASPERTTAYLGPGIAPCCYEIGEDVASLVRRLGSVGESALARQSGTLRLDLAAANAGLLATVGVRSVLSGLCTCCHRDLLYSHRGEGGTTGRFAAYVGIAP